MVEKLLGYNRDELPGQRVEILLPEPIPDGHLAHPAEYAAQPSTRPMRLEVNLRARRKGGSEFPAEVGLTFVPEGGRSGTEFQFTFPFEDRTAQADAHTEVCQAKV